MILANTLTDVREFKKYIATKNDNIDKYNKWLITNEDYTFIALTINDYYDTQLHTIMLLSYDWHKTHIKNMYIP